MSNAITNVDPETGEIMAMPAKEQGESNFRYIERLMEGLQSDDGDQGDELFGKILGAGSLQEQNDLWDSTSTVNLVGRRFVFTGFKVRPSTKPEGLAFMMVCQVEDPRTGEPDVITTGSTAVCAALLSAYYTGSLPAVAEVQGPKSVRKDDKTPLRLHWLGKAAS